MESSPNDCPGLSAGCKGQISSRAMVLSLQRRVEWHNASGQGTVTCQLSGGSMRAHGCSRNQQWRKRSRPLPSAKSVRMERAYWCELSGEEREAHLVGDDERVETDVRQVQYDSTTAGRRPPAVLTCLVVTGVRQVQHESTTAGRRRPAVLTCRVVTGVSQV